MKIVTHIHAYPPEHNAGAEWMSHSINKWMVEQGHHVVVLTTCEKDYEIDGVKVFRDDFDACNKWWRWADVAFTHLIRTGKAVNWSREAKTPLVYVVHNTISNRLVEVYTWVNIIYNTEHAREHCLNLKYQHNNLVLHPPVWFDDYHTNGSVKREYITLINCWNKKGGRVLIDLAKAMPDRKFAGVMGGYGEQEIEELPNLVYWNNTPNMKRIYGATRLLIMPSVYESYGRTAVEAMCSGIPVIATATPGLKESLSDCGTFVPAVDDVDKLDYRPFMEKIIELDNKKAYKELSLKSLTRAKELNERNTTELKALETWLLNIIR